MGVGRHTEVSQNASELADFNLNDRTQFSKLYNQETKRFKFFHMIVIFKKFLKTNAQTTNGGKVLQENRLKFLTEQLGQNTSSETKMTKTTHDKQPCRDHTDTETKFFEILITCIILLLNNSHLIEEVAN